jgi:hypothetical protein
VVNKSTEEGRYYHNCDESNIPGHGIGVLFLVRIFFIGQVILKLLGSVSKGFYTLLIKPANTDSRTNTSRWGKDEQ